MNQSITSRLTAVAMMAAAVASPALAEAPQAWFSAQECASTVYLNGFDSADDLNGWNLSVTNPNFTWQLGHLNSVPQFSSINPNSTTSLVIAGGTSQQNEILTSPSITIPDNAMLRFYSAFGGVWQFWGSVKLYINLADGSSAKLFDSFTWSQDNRIDDAAWNLFNFDLSAYAGKSVTFSFIYKGSEGESIAIDDFEVLSVSDAPDAAVSISVGETVHFTDRSKGAISAWKWEIPSLGYTSAEQNPAVKFTTPGVYDVTLTASAGDGSSSTVTRPGFVTVKAQAPIAVIGLPEGAYRAPYGSMYLPIGMPVTFTDLSTGSPTERKWTFTGTSVADASAQSVTVTYPTAGKYSIDLDVANAAGKSKAYFDNVLVGGEQNIWNITNAETEELAPVTLGWYGYYGGTNWLGMTAFAEGFHAPMRSGSISAVDLFFASVGTITPDAQITVSVAKSENGLPGAALASASMRAADLNPDTKNFGATTFTFSQPVTVDSAFFITVSGIPCNSMDTAPYDTDDIALYLSPRRAAGSVSTIYHQLTDEYDPSAPAKWYKNDEEYQSFAITPRFTYSADSSALPATVAAEGDVSVSLSADAATLSCPSGLSSATLYTTAGVAVMSQTFIPGTHSATLSLSSLPSGVYILRATSATSSTPTVVKIVKK